MADVEAEELLDAEPAQYQGLVARPDHRQASLSGEVHNPAQGVRRFVGPSVGRRVLVKSLLVRPQ
ncbi:MAG TPA: hypothetical protein PJ994_08855, partial [Tepidiformaceae bacterium]|nr:hypothetical protein [Tepidiformaceae bacterium]